MVNSFRVALIPLPDLFVIRASCRLARMSANREVLKG